VQFRSLVAMIESLNCSQVSDLGQRQNKQMNSSKTRTLAIVILVLLGACSAEGLDIPSSPLLATFERKSGLIAYIGLDGNIYTIDQSGGAQTAITDDAGAQSETGTSRFYNFPTWSQTDRTLAFLGISVDENGAASAEIFSNSEGQENEILFQSSNDFPFYLYWSPDGNNLSFLSRGLSGGAMALQIANAEGSGSTILDTGTPYYWAWSPTESQIIVHVGGAASLNPGEAKLSLLSVGSSVRERGLKLLPSAFQAPVFSSNGDYVVFAAEDQPGRSRLILATPDGIIRAFIADVEGPVAFDWAPQGDFIAYIESTRPANGFWGKLSFADLRNPQNPSIIETDADNVIAFFWSPDGEQVAYFVPAIIADENQEEPASSQSQEPEIFLVMYLANAQDGSTRQITSFLPSEGFLNILPFFDQYQRSMTIWSPDGNYIVVSALADDEGTPGIFVIPSSGSLDPRFLVEGALAFWSYE